jgi:hypothetical protein
MIDLLSLIGTIKGDERSRNELAQQKYQFNKSLAEQVAGRQQQGSQFGQTLAEQVASRGQQGSQFGQSLAEQVAGRKQQGSQFGQTLDEQIASRNQAGSQFNQTLDFEKEQWKWSLDEFKRMLASLGGGSTAALPSVPLDHSRNADGTALPGWDWRAWLDNQNQQTAINSISTPPATSTTTTNSSALNPGESYFSTVAPFRSEKEAADWWRTANHGGKTISRIVEDPSRPGQFILIVR